MRGGANGVNLDDVLEVIEEEIKKRLEGKQR